MKEHEIEELLRQANPEPDRDTLRMTSDTVRLRSASILDGRDTMLTQYQQPLRPAETPRGSRRRVRNLAVAAGAAAFVLVVIGGVGLLSMNGGDDIAPAGPGTPDVTQPVAEPSTPPTATTPPDAEPQVAAPGEWMRVSLESLGFPSGFSDVAAGPNGFVAVGLSGAGTSEDGMVWHLVSADVFAINALVGDGTLMAFDRSGTGPAVWNSTDGTAWTRTMLDDAEFGEFDEVNAAAHSEFGYVAVGAAHSDGTVAVWTSADGTDWTKVNLDGLSLRGEMLNVTFGDNGYVAVGRSPSSTGVWTSPDGTVWTNVSELSGATNAGLGQTAFYGVTFGNGRFIAVGVEGSDDSSPDDSNPFDWHAAVWTSTDGTTWERVPHDDEVFGYGDQELAVGMDAVAFGAAGYVAVGDAITATPEGDQRTAIWYSADGTTWERVSHNEDLLGGNVGLSSVTAIGSNWVAVGRDVAISWTWNPLG